MKKIIAFLSISLLSNLQAMDNTETRAVIALNTAIVQTDASNFARNISYFSQNASALPDMQGAAQAQVKAHAKKRIVLPAVILLGAAAGASSAIVGILDKDPGLINSGAAPLATALFMLLALKTLTAEPNSSTNASIINDALSIMTNPQNAEEATSSENKAIQAIANSDAAAFIVNYKSNMQISDKQKGAFYRAFKISRAKAIVLPSIIVLSGALGAATLATGIAVNDKELMMNGIGNLVLSTIYGSLVYGLNIKPKQTTQCQVIANNIDNTTLEETPLVADSH